MSDGMRHSMGLDQRHSHTSDNHKYEPVAEQAKTYVPPLKREQEKPKYITGAEVLRALADGHRVRNIETGAVVDIDCNVISDQHGNHIYNFRGNWELYADPATDAELIAKFRQFAGETKHDLERWAWLEAAKMLESRKV